MRTFDFAPFYRSTVGFDRMFSMLDQLGGVEGSAPSYPPYNIVRNDENAFRISVAVAGFTDADLSIEARGNALTIRGEKQTNNEEKTGDVLYKGIAERTFERSFQLADHVVVKGVSLANGLLEPHLDIGPHLAILLECAQLGLEARSGALVSSNVNGTTARTSHVCGKTGARQIIEGSTE